MRFSHSVAASLLLAWAIVPLSRADEVQTLRSELEALKSDYATRVLALEARIAQLETRAAGAGSQAPPPVGAPAPATEMPVPASPGVSTSTARSAATAFNPAMSVILAGNYANVSQDPETYAFAGFIPSGGEIGPGERSFNLGESELTMTANVDPYFFGNFTAAITGEDEIEVEEAFVRTLALPEGFTAKIGRFFSGLGYLNEIHAHAWDFTDQPLAYQAFFGRQLAQDGVQVKWLAPTDLFIELGAESGNGQGFPGTRRAGNGLNGGTVFVHVGSDYGDSASWRAGVSYVDLRAEDRAYDDTDDVGQPVVNSFSGTSRTWVGDVTFKWAPQSNPTQRNLKMQAEYLRRSEDGDLVFDVVGLALSDSYRSEQSGWYAQGVYQFRPRWRVGARYDALDSGSPDIGLADSGTLPLEAFPTLRTASPSRATVMLDWNPSEFSRLRAQYAWDDARDANDADRQWQLQYLYSLGAHGAHKF
jgi:hypothetical protein